MACIPKWCELSKVAPEVGEAMDSNSSIYQKAVDSYIEEKGLPLNTTPKPEDVWEWLFDTSETPKQRGENSENSEWDRALSLALQLLTFHINRYEDIPSTTATAVFNLLKHVQLSRAEEQGVEF